jgi:hypothetical protein
MMRLFLFVILILCVFSVTGLLNTFSRPSSPLHQMCIDRIPENTRFTHLLNSLVCGTPLNDPRMKALLVNSSLIHLVVVSGSHFLVLLILLKTCTRQRWLQFTLIFGYWIMTQAQAPGMLALLYWSLRQKTSAELRPDQTILLAGLACLLIDPKLFNSQSLYLSWLCGIGLSLSKILPASNLLITQLTLYTLINLLGGWDEWSHPLGILMNATVGVALSFFLFPLGAFVVATQFGETLFDKMTLSLIWILKSFGPPSFEHRHWLWNEWWWLWIASLHLLIWRWQSRSLSAQLTNKRLSPRLTQRP